MATGAERDVDPAAVAKTVEDALPEAPGEASTKLASPAASTSTSTALVLEEEALKASMLGSDEKFRSLADAQRFAEDCNELDRRMERREQLQQNLTGGSAAMCAGCRVMTQVCSLACVQHIRAAREYLVPASPSLMEGCTGRLRCSHPQRLRFGLGRLPRPRGCRHRVPPQCACGFRDADQPSEKGCRTAGRGFPDDGAGAPRRRLCSRCWGCGQHLCLDASRRVTIICLRAAVF